MSIVSNIYVITDIHCCFSSNIISCCATCFAQIEMFVIQCYNSTVSLLWATLQRSCYIPKHLGKRSSKLTKLKMQIFLRLSINARRKQSFLVFHGLHCLWANLLNGCCYFLYRNISSC